MKKTILALSLTAALISCKKDDPKEFTPTDVTGTSVVRGNVNKNVITPNGAGGWTSASASRVPAEGVNVSITVNKSSLYPNSSAQGADVYTGKTDANGDYAITVKSNADGVTARITIDGYTGTLDTLVNGQTKKGLSTAFEGTNMVTTLFMGQNEQINYTFNSNVVTTNPNGIQTGTATLTGSVSISLVKETGTAPNFIYSFTNAPVEAGHKVYLRLDKDPITQAPRVYETTTDANGNYTFNFTTVNAGTAGFGQNATIWINDFAATRDTLKANNTRVPGPAGVFQRSTINENALYSNTLRNAVYVRYNTFQPN